jgi:hypothetical protein
MHVREKMGRKYLYLGTFHGEPFQAELDIGWRNETLVLFVKLVWKERGGVRGGEGEEGRERREERINNTRVFPKWTLWIVAWVLKYSCRT